LSRSTRAFHQHCQNSARPDFVGPKRGKGVKIQ
jgi:hypothetical protein